MAIPKTPAGGERFVLIDADTGERQGKETP